MIDIVGKKNIYFAISLLVMVPGIVALLLWGLALSIDFTGGSRIEFQISNVKSQISNNEIEKLVKTQGVDVVSIQNSGRIRSF
jgi:preprotein translocase subunit SecF